MMPNSLLGIVALEDIVVADIEEAVRKFVSVGGEESWKIGRRIAERIIRAEELSPDDFRQHFVTGYLNQWKSRFARKSAHDLLEAMKKCRSCIGDLPNHIVQVGISDMPAIAEAFSYIAHVKGAGATTASKTLSSMVPHIFMMWDEPIASHYGFAQNENGYCRFLWLMADLARTLAEKEIGSRDVTSAEQLEEKIASSLGRNEPVSFAKLLDQWNWVRISSGK
ncbi:MAG: hypothetical protein QGD94_08370 [Planctomycetia bacterium]|nr:hypothetical protein [Planctomycetia bacterium]